MDDLKKPAVMGKKIFRLLEKHELLLVQDKAFPNIVTEITCENIVGSWWGHPLANPIYNGLRWLEHNHSILVVKLIDGKVTYVHENLFADIFSIVCKSRDWQLRKLKAEDHQILKYISKKKHISSDDAQLTELSEDPKKSLANLEKKLLICSVEKHTQSGKHIKDYMVWEKSSIAIPNPNNYLESKTHINNLVGSLSKKTGAKVKLPWQ
ncbi:MAG: hypothetical protein IPK04_20160 [Bdellovibrionales bacterium]|nr:hypothetical protein [Bdellovibrionales bacterium]